MYSEMYLEAISFDRTGVYSGILGGNAGSATLVRTGALFLGCLVIGFALAKWNRAVLGWCYRWRYVLAVAFVAICTIFSLSGSSISILSKYLNGEPGGLLFGIARSIRSDEYMVTMPLTCSQDATGYNVVSDILRATPTSVAIGYGLPSWSLITIFRPSHWCFLLFGLEHGLGLLWSMRTVSLFLVTFECAQLFTQKDKWLSATAAVIVTFSPNTVWWSSYNFVLYGQGLVLALWYFLHARKEWVRIACAALIAWLSGCYVMTMYPAWMVPYFYIFAFMGIWVVVGFLKDSEARKRFRPLRAIGTLVAFLVLLCVLILLSFQGSWDNIAALSNTVYPGSRFVTGGDGLLYPFYYGWSIFGAIDTSIASATITSNICESAGVFGLFPIGIILSVVVFKKRGSDLLLCLLLSLQVFFLIFMMVGVPDVIAAVTMMSKVPSNRLLGPCGLVDTVLLVRSVALLSTDGLKKTQPSGDHFKAVRLRKGRRAWVAVACAAMGAVLLVVIFRMTVGAAYRMAFLVPTTVVLFAIIYVVVRSVTAANSSYKKWLCLLVASVVLTSGLAVNPVQQGASILTSSNLACAVKDVLSSDESGGDWIATDSIATQNLVVAAGAPTINCVNSVPDLERWHILDPNGESENVYNRYAHIIIRLTSEETSFVLIQPDCFQVNLNYGDMEKLGIKYIVSGSALESQPAYGVSFTEVGSGDGLTIWRVGYSS